MPKKWYTSKTIQFAVLTAIAGILTAVTAEYPELRESGIFLTITGVVNFMLRFITDQPIQK